MLAQLRRKFIALNMTIATLVLLVVFGAICTIDHQTSVADILGQLNSTVSRVAESYPTAKSPQNVKIKAKRPQTVRKMNPLPKPAKIPRKQTFRIPRIPGRPLRARKTQESRRTGTTPIP